jgi:hypothetical protein
MGSEKEKYMETAELARQAMAIYENRLKAPLEKSHPDYFVAIEPVSGDYFLGETLSEASAAARLVHPTRRTYVHRVGHIATIHIGACEA